MYEKSRGKFPLVLFVDNLSFRSFFCRRKLWQNSFFEFWKPKKVLERLCFCSLLSVIEIKKLSRLYLTILREISENSEITKAIECYLFDMCRIMVSDISSGIFAQFPASTQWREKTCRTNVFSIHNFSTFSQNENIFYSIKMQIKKSWFRSRSSGWRFNSESDNWNDE